MAGRGKGGRGRAPNAWDEDEQDDAGGGGGASWGGGKGGPVRWDIRLVQRPAVFSGAHSAFRDWKYRLLNYFTLCHPELSTLLLQIESRSIDVYIDLPTDEADIALSRSLFAILASLCEGQSKSIVRMGRAAAERNGFEAYRLLLLEYASRAQAKRLLLRQQVSNPSYESTQPLATWRSHFDRWEETVQEFQVLSGKVLDKEELTTTLYGRAPQELRKQWLTTGLEFGENYV